MTIQDYAKKVQEMRNMQKEYFKNRRKSDMVKAKELEKEIDRITTEILAGSVPIKLFV